MRCVGIIADRVERSQGGAPLRAELRREEAHVVGRSGPGSDHGDRARGPGCPPRRLAASPLASYHSLKIGISQPKRRPLIVRLPWTAISSVAKEPGKSAQLAGIRIIPSPWPTFTSCALAGVSL